MTEDIISLSDTESESDSDSEMPEILDLPSKIPQIEVSTQIEEDVDSDNDVPEIIQSIINSKSKRRRTVILDAEDEQIIDNMIKEMEKAANDDIEANLKGLPALYKLKILNKVAKFLKVAKYHMLFLSMNGAFVLGKWLARLPDGSFPSTPLKLSLLESIQDIPIETEHLRNSELGRNIMIIYHNPNETQTVKRLSKFLIEKWSRMIYEIDVDYTFLEKTEVGSDENLAPNIPKPLLSLEKIQMRGGNKNSVRDPPKGIFDFKYRPTSNSEEAQAARGIDKDSVYKRLLKKKSKVKKQKWMSVDGRTLY
ncbi:unnamed protein product [Blepharisma stoltei]|uniref:TFIIS N-terminal domain-containing protein n=1 Tax=Blepharisma stoltei TaxID=1481888 RepID=A0AAU9JCL0_9CILI|nr:unnamed protein product [Blepharisma stoltei]